MFKSWSKSRDVITLFHKPSSQVSIRVLNHLKQASALSSETATQDQATDPGGQNKPQRSEFDIEVTENPPTKDQLSNILEYIGADNAGKVVKGATGEADALKKFGDNNSNFLMPVVVDWNNGKAVASQNESEILKQIDTTVFWKGKQ